MIDAFEKPWLLEVNRFPGLRPRSSMDTTVKQSVVYDAWLAAADRIGHQKKMMDVIRPLDYKSFSLIRITPE
jgi:mevalonate pyrophosphate decarboxylase